MRRTIVSRHGSAYTDIHEKPPIIGDGMGNNTKQMALLAAGYLLGRTKTMKTVLLVAGGVAYGRLTAQRDDEQQTDSTAKSLLNSPELQRITSGLADAARGVVSATASKGVEMLNQNLQNRSAALRENTESTQSTDQQGESQEDAEGSEEPTASED